MNIAIIKGGIKTQLVIPNKVYDGIAMKIPMITCNSPAISEVLEEFSLWAYFQITFSLTKFNKNIP